ncbi:hypothetical protein ES702_02859 [subsurface metagenome]
MKKKKDKKAEKVDLVKSEVNLVKFPFYTLDHDRFKRIKYEYLEIKKGGKTIRGSWEASPDIKMGLPTPFDAKVFRIIEMHIYKNFMENGKIINPLNIGSIYRICKILGIKHYRSNRKLIKEAIERLSLLGFITKYTFYSKRKEKYLKEASFHLFDRVWKGEELKNGEIADANYIYIAPLYKESIEAYYVKLLDFNYIKSLKSGIANRLYEILGIKFFGINKKNFDFIKYSYEKLCNLLPIKEQKYLSDIKRQLIPALKELRKTKFLEKYVFEKKGNKLFIKFYPGAKYFEEIKLDYAPKKKALAELKKIKEILKEKEDDNKFRPIPESFKKQIKGILKK